MRKKSDKECSLEIRGLIWYAEIIEKLETKHAVQQDEVREVLRASPKFRFVEKDKHAMILSAREMDASERKTYEKK
jgi:hypothetical protein